VIMVFRPQGLLGYTEINLNFVRNWVLRLRRRRSVGQEDSKS
jgi:hypothetical protein